MSLLGEIQAAQASSGPKRCPVRAVLAAMTDDDRADLEAAMADEEVHGTVIAAVLQKRGHSIAPDPIRRHGRRACSCFR